MKRSLTGIKATGNVHLGNLLGAIRPALEFQKTHQCLYFIADMHSLTTVKDGASVDQSSLDLAATWLACGLDVKKHLLYRQSDVPLVTELAWYLSCCTGVGLLEKAHAYKDAQAKEREVNHGTFAYPVLMAADILLYEPDIVPVGKDQKQHVEMARDMAGSLNAAYSAELLKLPEPVIQENVMTIPGLDGRKMSKSYGNEIPLFCDEQTLKKKILSIKTDSTPLEEPKKLAGTLLSDLFALFATKDQFNDLEKRLAKGGLGWGHAKEELYHAVSASLADIRTRYNEIRSDVKGLTSVLDDGAERAMQIAVPVLDRVRSAAGFRPFALHR